VIGWRLGGRVAALAAAVTLAVDPLMVHQSVVLQSDGPATALGVVAVAFAAVAATTARRRWSTAAAVLAGAALGFGFHTKFLDVAVALPLLGVLLGRGEWRKLLVATTCGGLLALAVILVPLHDAWSAIWSESVGLHIDSRSNGSGINVAGALTLRWHLAVVALVGAVIGWRRHRRLVVTGVLWFLGAVGAMAVTHPLWRHHAVVLSPSYALLCAAGVSAGFSWLHDVVPRDFRVVAGALAAGLCVAAGLFLWSGLRGLSPTNSFTTTAAALRAHTSASTELVGDDQFAQALAGRAAPPFFVDTSNTRMYAEKGALQGLESVTSGVRPVCAVLFSSGRLALLPGFSAWVSHRYAVTLPLGGSRYLYIAPGCA
jgi:4-amino-4-deoxy-L-arabinose transferase-like glycosyltransferase